MAMRKACILVFFCLSLFSFITLVTRLLLPAASADSPPTITLKIAFENARKSPSKGVKTGADQQRQDRRKDRRRDRRRNPTDVEAEIGRKYPRFDLPNPANPAKALPANNKQISAEINPNCSLTQTNRSAARQSSSEI